MERYSPIVAIAGSARREIVRDVDKETAARKACFELGQELAKASWRIAVYGDNEDYIEADVVRGFVAAGAAGKHSIVSYYPQGETVHFKEQDLPDQDYFHEKLDPSSDWEVSFYRSLAKVDGLLSLGGGPSTLIAGQIALSRDLPIVAVAHFGGSALKMWQQHLSSKPAFIDEQDLNVMARWNNNSAKDCVQSLVNQYNRRLEKVSNEQKELQAIREKATKWDEHVIHKAEDKSRVILASVSLVVFIIFLILGLTTNPPRGLYSVVTILGLCVAGGLGATVRMLTPAAPVARKWIAPVLGVTVGLVFSLLYLIPQLIQNSGFLIPVEGAITTPTRVQYICSLVVAFMAGLGFDYAIEQLLKRSRQSGEEIITAAAGGTAKS